MFHFAGDLVLISLLTSLFQADMDGKVKKTLLFKDLVMSSHSHITMSDPPPKAVEKDQQFRKLEFFQDKYLIAYSGILKILF